MKMRLPILFLFLFCVTFLAQGQQILVKAGNATRGLGTVTGYADHVLLSSFQVGIKSEASWPQGGGQSNAVGTPLEVQFTKYGDAFSNRLNLFIATGTVIPEMEILWLVQNSKGATSVVHKVELEDVYITEVMNSSAQECTSCFMIAESYKAVYKIIKRTVYREDRDGRFVRFSTFTWDIGQNTATID